MYNARKNAEFQQAITSEVLVHFAQIWFHCVCLEVYFHKSATFGLIQAFRHW